MHQDDKLVNEPIYDGISYFIMILTWSTTN